MSWMQLISPDHSLAQRVNDYMRPFQTATCQDHLIGALQQLPRSPTFPREESSIREQVALRLLQEVIVMGAQEQEALDACLVACGPLEALSACATTLQEITARNKPKKKKNKTASSVESPSILETALRTIRRWLVKGVSFPPGFHPSNSYEDRCWVEQVTATLSSHTTNHYSNHDNACNNFKSNNIGLDTRSPLVKACLESLTKLVLMFPVQIANACHALSVQLPTWSIASRFNPRLIEGALSMALHQQELQEYSYSESYFKLLVQHMVRSRNPDDVALGLYKYHERHYRDDKPSRHPPSQPKALCQLLLQLHRNTLSPRESAYLLRSIMISSIPRQSHATKIATTQLTELWQLHLYPYMELSCRPILVTSRRVREAFVRLLVLSPSSVVAEEWPDRLLCHCVASLLANPTPMHSKMSDKTRSTADSDSREDSSSDGSSDDSSDSCKSSSELVNSHNHSMYHHSRLTKHMQEVIATWSLAVFVRQTEYQLQRHVTNVLLSGMSFLQLQQNDAPMLEGTVSKNGPPLSELVCGLLEGVTVRLESSVPAIRKDGIMIAERLAQKMGQELQFDELDNERVGDDDETTFLQSVMTASEFPSHYQFRKQPVQPPRRLTPCITQKTKPRRLQERREQQIQQQQHQQKSQQHHPRQRAQQQQPQAQQTGHGSKKSERRNGKEELKKRRRAKREGKSDTRILDAIYGQMTTSSTTFPRREKSGGPCDSYEDSCTEVYSDAEVALQPPRTTHFQQSLQPYLQSQQKIQAPQHPMPRHPSPQSPVMAHSIQSRVQSSSGKPSAETNDSYDNSATPEIDINPALPPPLPSPHGQAKMYEVQSMQGHSYGSRGQKGLSLQVPQLSHFAQRPQDLQQPPQNASIPENPRMRCKAEEQQAEAGPNSEHRPIDLRGMGQEQQESGFDYSSELATIHGERLASDYNFDLGIMHQQAMWSERANIHQHGFDKNQQLTSGYTSQLKAAENNRHEPILDTLGLTTGQDKAFCTEQQILELQDYAKKEGAIHTEEYPPHDEMRINGMDEVKLLETRQGSSREEGVRDDNTQHVTFYNHECVIPELQQELYWKRQKTKERRQKHYKQQQVVEMQLQKQHEQHQKDKTIEYEREQKATLQIATKSFPTSHKSPSSKLRLPKSPGSWLTSLNYKDRSQWKDCSSPLAVETVIEDEELPGRVVALKGEDEDKVVAKCWTHKEVEMVLENEIPEHSPSSPLPSLLSPCHPQSPTKSPERRNTARRNSSPRHSPLAQRVDKSTTSGRGGDVPSLIFAMVDEEDVGENVNANAESEAKEKAAGHLDAVENPVRTNHIADEKNTINSVVIERVQSNPPPKTVGKPPLSPRSRGPQYKYRRHRPQLPSLSSSETQDQKDSLTSVRSRRHPQVDPAEIDARILAAACDHESEPSSNSAPSLSVYSSNSSEFSLYLHGDRARNEFSDRAMRPLKHAYSNAYQHMKQKYQQRRNSDDKTRCWSPILLNGRTPNAPDKRVLMVDPDAAYASDEDEEDYDDYDDDYYLYGDEATRSSGEDDDDDSSYEGTYTDDDEYDDDSVWEESEQHLRAYDLEDEEDDLPDIQQPRYLRDCLELLRAEDVDSDAYSKQNAALKWLPRLVQGDDRPMDLTDLAVPLVLELMRLENKFNVENFNHDKLVSVIALAAEEPLAVGQQLILMLWEDVAFLDRLDVLTVLSEAAFELSGNKKLEEHHKKAHKNSEKNGANTHGKQAYMKETYSFLSCKDNSTLTGADTRSIVSVHAERALGQVESKTRRWGRGRRQPEIPAFQSRFGPVANVWYYSLVGGFMQRKENTALWGGAIGARLLANMFVTLATIVECSGNAPGTDVLAKDLFELVWSFRTVDVAEVRMGVLVAVAAALSCLSEEVVLTMMFDGSLSSLPEGLKQMSQLDPDKNCRRLALSMSKGISGIVDSLQPVGKISKLSLSV